ncbi:hypothetical protein [Lactiplantibacillus modestisalitolerans]|uniref:Uncharacterized protein n=1 Tax=Lactiplantibacillus modestisalitolerans TaxID=1457219 RepID=A0ABV5WT31_9LACO|nr:hypothetical protein [Lactiplantibacillus modestisalitolerans]
MRNLQFIQNHFETHFRFRNAFESQLTVTILMRIITEHPESLLVTRADVERATGCSLDDPQLRREYFPQSALVLLTTALDELMTLSITVHNLHGRVRFPLFHSVQLDELGQQLIFHLNVDVLPQLTRWAVELQQEQEG